MSEWLYQFWLYAFKTPSLGVIKVWSPLEKQGEDIFIEKLLSGLSRNDFSHLDDNDISIALLRLLTIFNVSADQLLGEFLAFGIISRNFELVWSVLDNASRRRANLKDMFPFHLATSYLGSPYGFSSAFDLLFHDKFANTAQIREMYVNDRGHTVLDSLMIAIIKAHTSCVPGDVDEKMEGQRRFVGEEVDICGRWDATYSEIRFRLAHRLAQGWSGVPFDWKHSFCNTSTWAICKSISFMFDAPRKPDVNHRSGLFRKRCQHCMQECTLLPLHTLVMVAFRLAQQGREHEDLFGISACLSYLLSRGANPLLGSVLSATMLYGTDGNLGCTHEILTPLQLVKCIPRGILQHWSPALRRGWSMLGHLLRHSEGVWISPQPDDFHCNACSMITDTDGDATESNIAANDDSADKGSRRYPRCEPGSLHHFKGSRLLRDFYAAVETELLTDRQCHPWNHWAKNWSHRYTAFRRVLELLRPRLECSGTKCSLLLGGNCDFLFPRE